MSDPRSHSLKFEAEFFRKSNNLIVTREKKIRSIQMRTMHVLLLLALALLVGFGVYRSAAFLFECDMLQVHSFRLHREPVFARDELRRILNHSAGNILALDLRGLRARLLSLPEVEDVAISRVLPDIVDIGFTLRRPLFYYRQDNAFRLLDAGGLVLGEQSVEPAGLIPIRGNAGPALSQIAACSAELRPMRDQIEFVAFQEPYGIELKLRTGPEVFYPGSTEFAKKINRYYRIRPHLSLNGSLIRYVDLRIAGRIYFACFDEARGNS
jgi:cell division septal protein FtsQ